MSTAAGANPKPSEIFWLWFWPVALFAITAVTISLPGAKTYLEATPPLVRTGVSFFWIVIAFVGLKTQSDLIIAVGDPTPDRALLDRIWARRRFLDLLSTTTAIVGFLILSGSVAAAQQWLETTYPGASKTLLSVVKWAGVTSAGALLGKAVTSLMNYVRRLFFDSGRPAGPDAAPH